MATSACTGGLLDVDVVRGVRRTNTATAAPMSAPGKREDGIRVFLSENKRGE
jgi:hypothetical protein